MYRSIRLKLFDIKTFIAQAWWFTLTILENRRDDNNIMWARNTLCTGSPFVLEDRVLLVLQERISVFGVDRRYFGTHKSQARFRSCFVCGKFCVTTDCASFLSRFLKNYLCRQKWDFGSDVEDTKSVHHCKRGISNTFQCSRSRGCQPATKIQTWPADEESEWKGVTASPTAT